MATAYNLATGEILAAGAIEHLRGVKGLGYDAADSHLPADGRYDGDTFVAYTREQRAARQQRAPSSRWRWSNATMQWEDRRTLAERKESRWGAIKAERDAREFGGFVWGGSVFDSDSLAQARIMGAVQMAVLAQAAGQRFVIDWTLADNTVRTLDAPAMIGVGLALGAHVNAQHETGRALRAKVLAAADEAALAAVAWPP